MSILSDRVRLWGKKQLEKMLGRWEEGPEPPQRVADMVIAFAGANPRATRKEWADFAAAHAGEAWRTGYFRGLEYAEREPERWRPDIDPEVAAEGFDPTWKENPFVLGDPDEVVLEERDPVVDAREDMRRANDAARQGAPHGRFPRR